MPLKLPKRHANLNGKLDIQPKAVGEQIHARFGIPISTTLTPTEFGEVILNDRAEKVFWKKIRARESQPSFPNLGPQTLDIPIRDCKVQLWLHDRLMTLTETNLTGSRFLLGAAQVVWTFKAWALPTIDDSLKDLLTTFAQPILLSVDCPTWGAQHELPLEEEEEDEDDEEGEEADAPDVSNIQRQIEGNEDRAAKKKRSKKAS